MSDKVMVGKRYVGAWRWDSSDPVMARLKSVYDDGVRTAGEVPGKHSELLKNDNLTKQGVTSAMRNWFGRQALPAVARARKVTLPAVRREIEARREKISLEGPDKTDMAGALLRQEIRTYLRGLKPSQRTAMIIGPDVAPDVALAVLEAPAVLSDVTEDAREALVSRALEALHPGEMAAIQELEQAVETAERAIGAAERGFRELTGMAPHEFKAWEDQSPEAALEPARLKRWGNSIKVIRENSAGQMVAAEPTPEELATGVFIDGDSGGNEQAAFRSILGAA